MGRKFGLTLDQVVEAAADIDESFATTVGLVIDAIAAHPTTHTNRDST